MNNNISQHFYDIKNHEKIGLQHGEGSYLRVGGIELVMVMKWTQTILMGYYDIELYSYFQMGSKLKIIINIW